MCVLHACVCVYVFFAYVFTLRVCVLLPFAGSEMADRVRRLIADQRVRGSIPTHAGLLGGLRLTPVIKGYLAINSDNYYGCLRVFA